MPKVGVTIHQKVTQITSVEGRHSVFFLVVTSSEETIGVRLSSVVHALHRECPRLWRTNWKPANVAAHAMLKHIHAEHSRETNVRAMAMIMERQQVPRQA